MNELIKIEYPDRTIHNVDCYKFCMSILENGEKVFFIEYKDYGSNTSGEFIDSYGILTNNNGIWYKSDRRVDYYDLHSHVVKEYDPSIIGKNISFMSYSMGSSNHESYSTQTQLQPKKQEVQAHRRNYTQFGERTSDVLPQTQTETQRAEIPPVHRNDDNYVEATPDESLELQTQTQTQREKIPPVNKKQQEDVYILLPSDIFRLKIDLASFVYFSEKGFKYTGITSETLEEKDYIDTSGNPLPEHFNPNVPSRQTIDSLLSGFSQNYIDDYIQVSRKSTEKNDDETLYRYRKCNYSVASFESVDLTAEVINAIYKSIGRLEYAGNKATLSTDGLESFEIDGIKYHFVLDPYHIDDKCNEKLNIVVNPETDMNPEDILNNFLSQNLPIAEICKDYDIPLYPKQWSWEGFTKDREIIKLKAENQMLKEKLLGESTIVDENTSNYHI